VYRVLVVAAWGIFPRILHVDADIVEAFDLYAIHFESEISAGILTMPAGVCDAGVVFAMGPAFAERTPIHWNNC
jgi:hypothetical protein